MVGLGTLGFVAFEGWSLDDSLYMTVITMTTVGFREVRELDATGRLWTMLLAIAGVAIIFGSIGIVAESILSEAASGRRGRRRMTDTVGALSEHFILCGYGRVGATVARELSHAGIAFVVVDINPASLETATRDGFLVVEGDATRDDVLRAAGVDRARGLITTVDSDAVATGSSCRGRRTRSSGFANGPDRRSGRTARRHSCRRCPAPRVPPLVSRPSCPAPRAPRAGVRVRAALFSVGEPIVRIEPDRRSSMVRSSPPVTSSGVGEGPSTLVAGRPGRAPGSPDRTGSARPTIRPISSAVANTGLAARSPPRRGRPERVQLRSHPRALTSPALVRAGGAQK
ncbi:MAG: hypothetical protein C0498_06190 [Anaerolinea sp.]|nr:hypothetical protein [Anaerolinea sp.]